MKRGMLGAAVLLLAGAAWTAGSVDVRKTAQVSMLVTGSITVAPDGVEQTISIDHSEKLPPAVLTLIQENAAKWKFDPVVIEGKPVTAKAPMTVRVVAKPLGDGTYSLGIAGARFGQNGVGSGESVSYKTREIPRYPAFALRSRAYGTVYAVMRINRDGQVVDAAVEQTNLQVYGSARQMSLIREDLGKATLAAVKHWTFNIPVHGKHAADPYWDARVAVSYSLRGRTPNVAYGKWQAYIPGPRELVPWLKMDPRVADSADAIAAGSLTSGDQGLRLKTPISGS